MFRNVSQHYPRTLQRRLFSSVPYREWALRKINLELESELLLLTGASSSGKSTLLQMLLRHQHQQPTEGTVACSCVGNYTTWRAVPVYLDQKPPFESRKTVATILKEDSESYRIPADQMQCLVNDLLHHVDLSSQVVKTPAQLSPSEQYRLELVRASLTSMLADCDHGMERPTTPPLLLLPAPILLLDEWLDKETSQVVQNVQSSIGSPGGTARSCRSLRHAQAGAMEIVGSVHIAHGTVSG